MSINVEYKSRISNGLGDRSQTRDPAFISGASSCIGERVRGKLKYRNGLSELTEWDKGTSRCRRGAAPGPSESRGLLRGNVECIEPLTYTQKCWCHYCSMMERCT